MAMGTAGANKVVRHFWDKYIILLEKNGIKREQQRWFVRRVEEYIAHYSAQKLASHTPKQVTQYFHIIGRQKWLKDWQFTQAVRAIRTLFCDLLQADWSGEFDWDHWIDSAQTLGASHDTLARENGLLGHELLPEGNAGLRFSP